MQVIGLTGGIGSGKSTVAKIFGSLGAAVIDADEIAREIVEPRKIAWESLVLEFGKEILNNDGSLNRGLLAKIVFEDKNKREKLNGIMHPIIQREIMSKVNRYRSNNRIDIVLIEAALLAEGKGLMDFIDRLVLVSVDERMRIDRVKKRDGISSEEIFLRIRSQMSYDKKASSADFIIDNTGSIEETERQVKRIWNIIQN